MDLGVPKTLFKAAPAAGSISPDGQRFLLAVHPEGTQAPTVTVVSNWTAALKKP